MRDLKAQDAWRAQLKGAHREAVEARSLPALRRLASAYHVSLPGGKNLETARIRVLKALDLHLRAAGARQSRRSSAAPQGSFDSASPARSSISPACSSASSEQEQPGGSSAAAAATAGTADSQRTARECATAIVASPSETPAPVHNSLLPSLTAPPSPPFAPPQASNGQATGAAGDGGAASPPARKHADNVLQPQPPACQQQPASQPSVADALPLRPAATRQRAARASRAPLPEVAAAQQQTAGSPTASQSAQQQLLQLQQQVGSLAEELAAAKHALAQMQRQLQSTHSAGLRSAATLVAVEQQVQELMAASTEQAATRDSLNLLQSRHEQLRQRQQQEECACGIVFKASTALPAEGTAAHLQQLLSRHLQLSLTVVKVQPMHSTSGGGSADSPSRRQAYRIRLGSRGEQAAVLRVKAQRLRGTDMSIDVLLTPEQLASRHQLQPVARQARSAGRSVRWRYGKLLIDGQVYTGPGSVPSPKPSSSQAAAATLLPQPPKDDDGWQTVQRRQHKGWQQRPTGASKKALFTGTQQQQKQQQQGVGNKAKPKKPQGSNSKAANGKAAQRSSKTASTRQQQMPVGGAGGPPPRVASTGSGRDVTPAPTAQALAGHGSGPTHAESPPMAAGSSSQQPRRVAGAKATTGTSSAAVASSPSSPARA